MVLVYWFLQVEDVGVLGVGFTNVGFAYTTVYLETFGGCVLWSFISMVCRLYCVYGLENKVEYSL